MAKEFSFLTDEQMRNSLDASLATDKQEPQVRIVRVLEYVGPREAVYKDLEKRYIKGSTGLPVCAGKGTLREISLEEVEFLGEDETESKPEEAHLYRFASVRGDDFEVEGTDPEDAWKNLCHRESENSVLWRCNDPYRNESAVEHEGFTKLNPASSYSWPVYKQVIVI